jgi:DNA modification methylase
MIISRAPKALKENSTKSGSHMNLTNHLICFGDAARVLRTLPDEAFQLMVTSPPYWNVGDYGVKDRSTNMLE